MYLWWCLALPTRFQFSVLDGLLNMWHVRIQRLRSDARGTFGSVSAWMRGDAQLRYRAVTLELPWRDNASNVSSIQSTLPPGVYMGSWTWSPRFRRRMYLVHPVAGRSGIRIHSANLAGDVAAGYRSQLNGCIAFGQRYGLLAGQPAVLLSAPAVTEFERLLQGATFELEILKEGQQS